MLQGNILGEPFDDFVKKQIEVRQKKLGNSDSKYSTKTPWIRLASSVDIQQNTKAAKDLNNLDFTFNDWGSDKLARRAILTGGTLDLENGIWWGYGNSSLTHYDWPNSAYAINDTTVIKNGATGREDLGDRGYVPMPGVESVNISYQNNGALAKATIKIKCYTKRQLALIDYLYLRPGYTLLLEFGWSNYYDNNGNFVAQETFTKPLEDFFFIKGGKNQYEIYSSIQNEKIKRDGNYEAFLGKITNFKWSLNKDGSYDCETILTTLGDVIESLKLNVATNGISSPTPNPEDKALEPVITYQNLSKLHQILFNIHEKASSKSNSSVKTYRYNMKYVTNTSSGLSVMSSTIDFKNTIWSLTGTTIEEGFFFDTKASQTYIKFGVLCAILQTEFLIYNKNTPVTGFDIKYEDLDNDYNYMLTFPGHISADPSICLIPITDPDPILLPQLNNYNFIKQNNKITPEYKYFSFNVDGNPEDDPFKGRISNVFVNINYLSKLATNMSKNENNNISILDYIKEVLNGISSALGGINNFSIELDINNGLIKIYDKVPQITLQKRQPIEYAKFNIFGVKPGVEGNFVREVNMSSELSSNFASMVSIGAQSQGNQISGNATSFSEFNQGLIDRIIPEKITPTAPPQSTNNSSTKIEFNDSYVKVYNDKKFLYEYLESLKTILTEYNKLFLGFYFKDPPTGKKVKTPFFLPFNLSLTMDGLAGMVLYQKFLINENVLPLSYGENNVEFIIKGIDHTVNVTGWTTKIETISSPIPK